MTILPQFVLIMVPRLCGLLFQWFSAQLYAELLKHAYDHFLIELQATLSFDPLETGCAAFHTRSWTPVTYRRI